MVQLVQNLSNNIQYDSDLTFCVAVTTNEMALGMTFTTCAVLWCIIN